MSTKQWYSNHEGWLGALMLFIGAFSIGLLTATFLDREACTKQTNSLTTGFNILLGQKDQVISQKDVVISRLSTSTATASDAAAKASGAAVKASGAAVEAAQEDNRDAAKH
jgi:hypothetical protein